MALSKPTPKAKKRIEARMASNLCLAFDVVDGELVECNNPACKLGNCNKHAAQFYNEIRLMTPSKAESYRMDREREGTILKRQQQRTFTSGNYFKRLASR